MDEISDGVVVDFKVNGVVCMLYSFKLLNLHVCTVH